ncbi:Gfo/Idh/MocA family oxidoreductase [Salinibacterium sp. SYSU T00001]|uniref:Gfo/Idh/MocA family protein n=1 Tax=Homoserinimonas sedimenticola TaxID=2986805 RepID=UPI00223678C1|nr:Gfo/Idh/MocA family oxidoreductase [Salinibacterium sedimenticola]MCW4385910.1 Gfo/Idh/MocA family oxidoreductase [Salinibacterium sedimenticola]
MPYGVGLIGAGPGVEALHIPTLARLAEHLRVVHVSGSGSGRAAALGARLGVRASTGSAELLADSEVQVVAICSPPERHAEQILAAVAAGKRAILCEKPLALSREDAEAAIDACRASGTALIIGTNHLFDPAWNRTKHHLLASGGEVRALSVTAALPPNGRYHEVVAEPEASAVPQRPRPDWGDPVVAAGIVRQLVLGLAIHDLPALRDLAPHAPRIVFARPIAPIGYSIGYQAGEVLVQLTAVMVPGGADALWRMSVMTSLDRIDVEFPPAFVHAGSANVTVRTPDGRINGYPLDPSDGYVEEWCALLHALDGTDSIEYAELLDDALYAIELADAAAHAIREGGRR